MRLWVVGLLITLPFTISFSAINNHHHYHIHRNHQHLLLRAPLVYHHHHCTDSNVKCCKWASLGECTHNPVWMKAHCKRACGTCHCKGSGCKPVVTLTHCLIPLGITYRNPTSTTRSRVLHSTSAQNWPWGSVVGFLITKTGGTEKAAAQKPSTTQSPKRKSTSRIETERRGSTQRRSSRLRNNVPSQWRKSSSPKPKAEPTPKPTKKPTTRPTTKPTTTTKSLPEYGIQNDDFNSIGNTQLLPEPPEKPTNLNGHPKSSEDLGFSGHVHEFSTELLSGSTDEFAEFSYEDFSDFLPRKVVLRNEDSQSFRKAECFDKNTACARYISIGGCHSNPTWMFRECRRSCNACDRSTEVTRPTSTNTAAPRCRDLRSTCNVWRRSGLCSRNVVFMSAQCPFSCRKCR